MSKVLCANAIGCLIYATVCTKLDLAHTFSVVSKFLSNSRQYWDAVKWIFIYLKGTIDYGIIFSKHHGNPLAVRYVDANYACDLDDRRFTICYIFTLVRGPIYWKSMVRFLVALSTTES
jgi:hypothetical protein